MEPVTLTPFNKDGVPLGEQTGLGWLHAYPKGLSELLEYVKEKYNNPYVIIIENGVSQENNEPLEKALKDDLRIRYHSGHLSHIHDAIKKGANVGGYFIWSWLDDYEWGLGYTFKAGINFVDRHNGLKRHPKDSFYWFKRFLAKDPALVA